MGQKAEGFSFRSECCNRSALKTNPWLRFWLVKRLMQHHMRLRLVDSRIWSRTSALIRESPAFISFVHISTWGLFQNFIAFGKRHTGSARRENMLQIKLFRQELHFVIIWNGSHLEYIQLGGAHRGLLKSLSVCLSRWCIPICSPNGAAPTVNKTLGSWINKLRHISSVSFT